jgi:hypothetical protein
MSYIEKTKFKHLYDFVAGEDMYEYYVYEFKYLRLVECETGEQYYSINGITITYETALKYLNDN